MPAQGLPEIGFSSYAPLRDLPFCFVARMCHRDSADSVDTRIAAQNRVNKESTGSRASRPATLELVAFPVDHFARVRKIAITALFADDTLVNRIVLKGGSALSLVYGIGRRTSLD